MSAVKSLSARRKEIIKEYDKARASENEEAMGACRKELEKLHSEAYSNGQAFFNMFKMNNEMERRGNSCIDFDDDYPYSKESINVLKEFGVKEFTLSSNSTSVTKDIWELTQQGYKIDGMTEINGSHEDLKTGKFKKVPAFRFTR